MIVPMYFLTFLNLFVLSLAVISANQRRHGSHFLFGNPGLRDATRGCGSPDYRRITWSPCCPGSFPWDLRRIPLRLMLPTACMLRTSSNRSSPDGGDQAPNQARSLHRQRVMRSAVMTYSRHVAFIIQPVPAYTGIVDVAIDLNCVTTFCDMQCGQPKKFQPGIRV